MFIYHIKINLNVTFLYTKINEHGILLKSGFIPEKKIKKREDVSNWF